MPGLFGLLNLSARSLATQRQGVEVAGHNLANVNNPAYARQRLSIATTPPVKGELGPQGTGAEGVAIVRLRSQILDSQIQSEVSVRGSLQAQQTALQFAQSNLGQELDSTASGTEAGSSTDGVRSSHSLADGLSDLFSSLQALSTNPSSLPERQSVLASAANLATQFNQVDRRLGQVQSALNQSVQDDTDKANALLAQIATLNEQIRRAEMGSSGQANDLRDSRQSQIEELAKLAKIDVTDGGHGSVNISISGTLMVSANQRVDSLQAYDAGGGRILVRSASGGTSLTLSGGQIQGTLEARDGAVADLRTQLNSLASTVIQQVNTVHAAGFSLTGSTGAAFFTGTNAADMSVNRALTDDPALLQAASVAGAPGDNGVALALAQLAQKPQAALDNQTFNQNYTNVVTGFGQAVASVNSQLADQEVVDKMLLEQRDSISGVSLDEEMTDLTKFQRAFEASAKLLRTTDELLTTVVNLKQ